MSAPFSFMGASDLLIDVLSDVGAPTGLQLKGNCPTLSVKADSERIEQVGTGQSNFGQVIASVTIPKPMSAAFAMDQVDHELFAMAFFGTSSVFTQAAATLTDQGVTTIADRWVEVGKLMIKNVVVKSQDGATTYVEDTDYTVHTRLGMIQALSTGAIPADGVVNLSCSYEAISGSQMAAMTKTNVRCRLLLDGQNYADGRRFILDIYQARLAPSGDFGFQAGTDKKFMEAKFDATLETPTGKTEPFKLIWLS